MEISKIEEGKALLKELNDLEKAITPIGISGKIYIPTFGVSEYKKHGGIYESYININTRHTPKFLRLTKEIIAQIKLEIKAL